MLAGHLKMTVGELEQRMDSRELSEWLAFARYYQPLDNSWAQAGVIASATLAPYSKKGHCPKPADFIPTEQPPQHRTQMLDVLAQMKHDLDGK
jgi:hypothetical protein